MDSTDESYLLTEFSLDLCFGLTSNAVFVRKPGVISCGSSLVFATPHLLTREHDQLRDTRPMKYWLVDGLLDVGNCWCAVTCDGLRETHVIWAKLFSWTCKIRS